MKRLAIGIVALLLAVPATATNRLMKLSEDHYLITVQKHTGFGGEGRAIRLSYAKAASLCVVLDYSWFEVLDTQSHGRGWGTAAASTLDVRLYRERDEGDGSKDLLNCEELATEEQKQRMREALHKVRP